MSRSPRERLMDLVVPLARGPVCGTFRVPASKSVHQRALVLGALSDVPPRLAGDECAPGDDVRLLQAALGRLGRFRDGALGPGRERLALDLGRGATGFRFCLALCPLRRAGARTLVRGHPSLLHRPHAPLARALKRLGARLKRRHSGAYRVLGGGLRGGRLALPASVSSQYASALLLVAPVIGGLELTLEGRIVSRPYLDLTLDLLGTFGVPAGTAATPRGGLRVTVPAARPRAEVVTLPPDASAAAAWWAAAALTGGEASVAGLGRASAQADAALLGILVAMGATVRDEADGRATVVGPPDGLVAPGAIDLSHAPDLLPLVGALAGAARGTTRIGGAGHARFKESDRLETVRAALVALGGRARIEGEDLLVEGGGLGGGEVAVAGDHRIAFAFGVLGLVVPGVVLRGAEAVSKSHPAFLEDLVRAAGAAGEGPRPAVGGARRDG